MPHRLAFFCAVSLLLLPLPALAQAATASLVIRNHRFEPAELFLPAATKVAIAVRNLDATPEEFESSDLNREKIVAGNAEITVIIGPLDPGSYGFFGDFHQETAQGIITVK
jgi:hypothetical protein